MGVGVQISIISEQVDEIEGKRDRHKDGREVEQTEERA